MFEIITESNRQEYYKRLYIDEPKLKKQRLIDTLTFAFLGLLFGIAFLYMAEFSILGFIITAITTAIGGYAGYKKRYTTIRSQVRQQEGKVSLMFPEFLQTFISLLDANPSASIVTILETTVPYLKQPIKNEVMKLVKAIYTDGRNESVRHSMMVFAQYMNTDEAMRIMMLIYSMYEEGSNPSMLKELEDKVDQLNQNKVDTYVNRKGRTLAGKSFPALVLGIAFIFAYIGLLGVAYVTNAMQLM